MSDEINNNIAVEQAAEPVSSADLAVFEEMAKAGILYGRKKSKTNPRMAKYIFATRNGFEIFDLTKTLEAIEKTIEFLKGIKDKKGSVLLVGTQPAIRGLIEEWTHKMDYPFVIERWLGGTLTNFQTISKRIKYYIKLKQDRASGKLEKYTKKERLGFDREIERLNELMGGLEKMEKLPDAVLIVDGVAHHTAVREAKKIKIPIVGIFNSDNNPDEADYLIPANTSSKSSVSWIFNKLFQNG